MPDKPFDEYTQSEIDQELAQMRDFFPKVWWALYQGSKHEGFTDIQALQLVMAYIKKPLEPSQ